MADDLGPRVLASIEGDLDEYSFKNWFGPQVVRFSSNGSGELKILASNDFTGRWLKEHYLDLITSKALEQGLEKVVIEVVPPEPKVPTDDVEPSDKDIKRATFGDGKPLQKRRLRRFKHFVCDETNRFAFAAAERLANRLVDGVGGDLLYIYGSTGLGKSHLLEAVQTFVRERNSLVTVDVTTAKEWTRVRVAEARESKDVRKRTPNLWIVDDLQELPQKQGMVQKDFSAFFDQVSAEGGSILVASMKSPEEMDWLLPELVSRLKSCLVVDVDFPGQATRLEILRKLVPVTVQIEPEALVLLAQAMTTDIRSLKGVLKKLLHYMEVVGGPGTVELARRVLGTKPPKQLTVEDVVQVVAKVCGYITPDAFMGGKPKTRKSEVVFPRQLVTYLLIMKLGMGKGDVRRLLGVDYSTVNHSEGAINKRLKAGDSRVLEAIALLDKIAQGLG